MGHEREPAWAALVEEGFGQMWEHRWESHVFAGDIDHEWLSRTLLDYSAAGWELVGAVTAPASSMTVGSQRVFAARGEAPFGELVLFFKRPAG